MKVGVLCCSFLLLFMFSVVMIGRWSEESAVMVFHVVAFVMLFCTMVMSGEVGCWFFAMGILVGWFVFIVV